jgi:hypothetical protein
MNMKHNLKYKFTAAALMVALLWGPSCKKVDFGRINNNPNTTTAPITSALLTNALSSIGSRTWDGGGISSLGGLYCQYFAETQYTDESRYSKTTTNWDGYYAGVMYDLQNIINYNSDPATAPVAVANGSNANQIAVAKILLQYNFWLLTDTWGDLPYTQALKGKGVIPYDPQQTIYMGMLKTLTEAVQGFDNGKGPDGDILFNGNVSKWKKFGNSLRMLIALRMSKADKGNGAAEFNAALNATGGFIEDNNDNATLAYPGGSYLNPFYNYYNIVKRDDYSVATTIMDYMTSHGDLRNTIYGTSTVGFPYGLTRDLAVQFANSNINYSRLMAPSVATETSGIPVVTAAHIFLARAEAANLGWTNENVVDLYDRGIAASWSQWGIDNGSSLANYLANGDVDLGTGNKAKKIATQQWIAWYPNGWQGWSVWRKTGYPELSPAPGTSTIPRRLSYGPNEPQLNPANYTPAAAQYTGSDGTNSQFARIWWDQ